jgi:hypothetical protein
MLDFHQADTDLPTEFVSKCVAELLVRRLLFDRISKRLIKRRAVNLSPLKASDVLPKPRRYIPTLLPFREIPGLTFQVPLTPEGRDVGRFCARDLKNHVTKKPVGTLYVQRLPREILASNMVQM